MRHILLSFLLYLSTLVAAQIPNYEFENWDNYQIQTLENWVNSGNFSKSLDKSDGTSAIRLENKLNSEQEIGFVANTDITKNPLGGQPYSDIPLVMRFDAKFDLAQGDVAKAIAIFKASGQAIGSVDFSMTGNTADTFVTYKIPIQWLVSATPDSIILLFVSNDFDNSSINGDGYLIVDNVIFESIGVPNQQVENPSFENWNSIDVAYPTSWHTTSLLANQSLGIQTDVESVVKSIESHSGFSVLLQNRFFNGDILPGLAFTGTEFDVSFSPAFEVSNDWENLQGYYKYSPENNDTGVIAVLMYQNGSIIGSGQFDVTNQVEDMTYFSTPITYFSISGTFPDSASVIISSSDFDNPRGINTRLWVDKLSFTNDPAGIVDYKTGIRIYPNPSTSDVTISVSFNAESFKVINLLGEELISSKSNKINVSHLPSGSYIIRVTGNGNILSTNFVKL